MRIARIVLGLLAAVALAGCIFHPGGHASDGGSDGHRGGPPPGRGWRK
jgi:hypothetical protein